jgi:predicted enzyme related to lactoylglutathione lyase
VRVGGRYRIAMLTPDGETFVAHGTYREVVPAQRLVMTWAWEEDDPADVHESLLTLEFAAHEDGTELTLTHENLASLESRERHGEGWNAVLAKMDHIQRFAIRGIDVSGYMVKDAPRAIAFYCDVLGLMPTRIYDGDRGAEYDLAEGVTFCLWGGGGQSPIPFQPSNGVLFAVDDFDTAVASLKARKIPIVMELELPNCRMAGVNDSEGNLVMLHKIR